MQLRLEKPVQKVRNFFSADNSPRLAFIVLFLFFSIVVFTRLTNLKSPIKSSTTVKTQMSSVMQSRGIFAQTSVYGDPDIVAQLVNVPSSNVCSILQSTSNNRVLKIGDSISNNALYFPDAVDIAFSGASTFWFVGNDQPATRATFEAEISNGGFAAVLMLGTNDCGGINTSTFISNLRQMVSMIRNNGIIPILSTIPPRDPACTFPDYNSQIISLAQEQGLPIRYMDRILSPSDMTDGVHPSNEGVFKVNSATCQIIDSLKQRCGRSFNYYCGQISTSEVPPDPTPNPPSNPNPPSDPGPTNPPPTNGGGVGSGMCSKLGINTAVPFSDGRVNDQYGRGGSGWLLSIAFTPGDINPQTICSRPQKTIIRPWCVGVNCEMFNSRLQELAGVLNSMPCEVYVTGPNEPESELHDAPDIATAAATMTNNLANLITNPNVKVLSPVINATHPNRGSFVPALSSKLNWGRIHGLAMNSYSLPGGNTASNYVEQVKNLAGVDKPIYITETGMIEQNSGVDRETAVRNMTAELAVMAGRGDVEAVLFFNGSGLNPQADFLYGCINGSELPTLSGNTCTDDGFDCGNIDGGGLFAGEAGCCENKRGYELSSCNVDQIMNNGGQEEGLDAVNAGVQMKELADGTWIYKYAVTEHIHNMPLLKFLSAIEGTDKHPFTTDPQDDNALNTRNQDLTFTNQFPGIATFQLSNGANFQLQVPSLGTAAAAGQYNRRNFYDEYRPHCGLYYKSDEVDEENIEIKDLIDFFKRWLDDEKTTVTEFDESTKTNFLQRLVDWLKGFFDEDTCANKCGDTAGIDVKTCNNSDAYVFTRDFYEVIVDSNIIKGVEPPFMDPLKPDQVCDNMFLSNKVQGGSCTTTGPLGTITLDEAASGDYNFETYPGLKVLMIELGAADLSDVNISEADAYNAIVDAGNKGTKITGRPFWKIEFGGTPTLQLEGLLKSLEEVYRVERLFNPRTFEGKKICHNDNVGIKVTSTKRLYDYLLTYSQPGQENAPLITAGLDNFEAPPEQVFYAVDGALPKSRYNSCRPETQYFDKKEKAKAKLATTQGGNGNSSSLATVEHIFPWVGQLPLMWERIAVWSLNTEYDFTDAKPELDRLLEIMAKIKEINADFSNVYLFPCGFFDPYFKNDTASSNYGNARAIVEQGLIGILGYTRDDVEALAKGDCICGQEENDPLESYLQRNGRLEEELARNRQDRDTDGDGMPDFCEAYTGNYDSTVYDQFDTSTMSPPINNARITQRFGDGSSIDYCSATGSKVMRENGMCHFHTGIDVVGSTVIKAAADGRVVTVGDNPSGYGNYVTIFHEQLGVYTLYAHMADDSIRVQRDQQVQRGDQIGIMGTTGNSDGVHLHFEIRSCDRYVKDCFRNPEALFTGEVPETPDPEIDEDIPNACKPFLRDVPIPEEGSFDNYACLMKKVANIVNTQLSGAPDRGIPWEVLWATMYNETKTRCTPSHVQWRKTNNPTTYERTDPDGTVWQGAQIPDPIGTTPNGRPIYRYTDECLGNPNQLAFYIEPNEVDHRGRGVGQFMPTTFDALMTNNYWYNTSNNTETGAIIERCIAELGVDISQPLARERDFDIVGSPDNSFNTYRSDEFSRIRVADSLCAAAVMLAENSMGARGGGPYATLADWAPGARGYDLISNAAIGYYGSCGRGYCDSMFDRYQFALDFFKDNEDYACNGRGTDFNPEEPDEDDDGVDESADYKCPYFDDQEYYIRQGTDGPSHSLCEYRSFYERTYGEGSYKALDLNIDGTDETPVRAPASGILNIVPPWENPYTECNGPNSKYDGGWAFEIQTQDGKLFRLLHLKPDVKYPVEDGETVPAGLALGILFNGVVEEDRSYNASGGGCFSSNNRHIHLTIIGGDPESFIGQYCHDPYRINSFASWDTQENTCCVEAGKCNCNIQNSNPETKYCAPN